MKAAGLHDVLRGATRPHSCRLSHLSHCTWFCHTVPSTALFEQCSHGDQEVLVAGKTLTDDSELRRCKNKAFGGCGVDSSYKHGIWVFPKS